MASAALGQCAVLRKFPSPMATVEPTRVAMPVHSLDIAEAVVFLAYDRAAKSTGGIINVDAGNAVAFTR